MDTFEKKQLLGDEYSPMFSEGMESPMFSRMKINFQPAQPITHLVVNNFTLVLAMTNKVLVKIELPTGAATANPPIPVDIPLYEQLGDKVQQVRIKDMFLDPFGKHLIVSTVSNVDGKSFENFYYYLGNKRVGQAVRILKGHCVSAAGFNWDDGNSPSTGFFLLGTTAGQIYELELTSVEDSRSKILRSSPEQYSRLVYTLPLYERNSDRPMGVTGVEFRKLPQPGTEQRAFIFVTTSRHIMMFEGSFSNGGDTPILGRVFLEGHDVAMSKHQEYPNDLAYSHLRLFAPKPKELPTKFAFMIGPGVFHGDLQASGDGKAIAMTNTSFLEFSREKNQSSAAPLSIALTEFHVLVLSENLLRAYCLLNDELVYQDNYPEGRLLGIVRDPHASRVWIYNASSVHRYTIRQEDRNIWEIYLSRKQFRLAEEFARENPLKLNEVRTVHAADLFQQKKYEESARLYAQTCASFEEIALKFLEIEEEDSLRILLHEKLRQLKPDEKAQITMVTLWLVQIYLNQLGILRTAGSANSKQYESLLTEYRMLLANKIVHNSLENNKKALYRLISNHGDEMLMVDFAERMKDYDRVIQYHIQHGNYAKALEVLDNRGGPAHFYKYSPLICPKLPKETVDVWIAQNRRLDPTQLITSLVQSEDSVDLVYAKEAIRYLEFCVDQMGNRDEALHNYLVSLYARVEPDKLMNYIKRQGQDQYKVNYDLKYALRICAELQLSGACIHIYTTLELFEEAVDLALRSGDINQAKEIASLAEEDEELKKKLWLKIAKHVVGEERDIKRAMEVLQECDLIKIEDILPFFPEFASIDDFKEAICHSLREYKQHINNLHADMEQAEKSAKQIKEEIFAFKSGFTVVSTDDKCALCNYTIMNQSFYTFPCSHMFHAECIINQTLPHLLPNKCRRVEELRYLYNLNSAPTVAPPTATADNVSVSSSIGVGLSQLTERQRLMNELDDLVASECFLCGELMISLIDEPFIKKNEWETERESWL